MKGSLEFAAYRSFDTAHEAVVVERRLKKWKNPAKALEFLRGSETLG